MEPDTLISATAAGPAPAKESAATAILLRPWKEMVLRRGLSTLKYLATTEVHTFAFSVAANAILSLFPFMVLVLWLVRYVFHSPMMADAFRQFISDHLLIGDVDQHFVIRNLNWAVTAHHRVKIASIIMLLITSSGVFLPLEVAFNRIWGFAKNRSYLGNQLISFLLAVASGCLILISVGLAAGHESVLTFLLQGHASIVLKGVMFVVLKIFATVASVAIFFLIYWVLPNGKVRARTVLPAAVAMGILWELGKYVYMLVLPWLNFQEVYGPFYISVTLVFWAFISGLLVLAGAHLAAGPAASESQIGSPEDPVIG